MARPEASDLRFEALLQNFLQSRQHLAPGTRTNDKSIAKKLRESFPLGMTVFVRSIRTSDLLEWLNRKESRAWSGSYFNTVRLFLRGMFDLAVADRIFDEATNPFKLKLIKPRRRGKTIRRIPTLDQFEAILADVRVQRRNHKRKQTGDFLEFLGLAGVGQAEARSFTWSDDRVEKLRFVRQKTGKEFFVPVYAWLAPFMQKLREQRGNAKDGERVFRIDESRRALTNAYARLGFHHFTQRNLRAFCIKRLYDAGVDVKQIAKWQGHSDGGVLIQNTYTEVFSDADAIAENASLALIRASVSGGAKSRGRKIVRFAA